MPGPLLSYRILARLVGSLFALLVLFACRIPSLGPEPPLDDPTNQVSLPSVTPLPPETSQGSPTPPETARPDVSPIPSLTPLPQPSLPDPAGYRWEKVASGFERPLDLTHAGDGSGRLFLVEQGGLILIIQDGEVLPDPFLDLRDRVRSSAYEQGLLGLAFHPNYPRNGYFFVNYTDRNGDTIVARFRVSSHPDRANPDSELILLQVDQPYANHNGGGLAFGPDGYLYIGLGDGGSAGDPLGNAQNLDTLLGKMLRIDVDRGSPYAIPADNPFLSGRARPEIWAYGLRNPWRFAFDSLTGDLYIADVGQNTWEEVDFLPGGIVGGANFGWNYFEGTHPYLGSPPENLFLVTPIAEYDHAIQHCSITGGEVYRGAALPEWFGVYFFADYCSGVVWGLIQAQDGAWQAQPVFDLPDNLSSFGLDQDGEIYLLGYGGVLYKLTR